MNISVYLSTGTNKHYKGERAYCLSNWSVNSIKKVSSQVLTCTAFREARPELVERRARTADVQRKGTGHLESTSFYWICEWTVMEAKSACVRLFILEFLSSSPLPSSPFFFEWPCAMSHLIALELLLLSWFLVSGSGQILLTQEYREWSKGQHEACNEREKDLKQDVWLQFMLSWPTQTHPEVCFNTLLGIPQSSQADNQQWPSLGSTAPHGVLARVSFGSRKL